MYLKRLHNLLKTISFKVAVWYTCIFILSSLLLFLFVYYFLSTTLKKQDHEHIRAELREICSIYETNGMGAIEDFIAEKDRAHTTSQLFIRIADRSNTTRRIFYSERWQDFDIGTLEKRYPGGDTAWMKVTDVDSKYVLDISSAQLSEGHWVQVGMSSEAREKILRHFREIFIVVIIPLFILGLAGGVFLSHQTLQPIRNLITTVRSIDIATMTAKLPRSMTEDELDELSGLFNDMLDNIYRLINGMKHSLDNVAHDLRTPMTRLRNIAEIALQADKDANLLKEALEKSVEESGRILNMLDTLMDISETEIGMMSIDRQVVDISLLIEKVAEMYQFVAEEKGVNFHAHTPGKLHIAIDSTRISQAVANIVDNAIKFTPAGGHITVDVLKTDREVIIETRDTGIGIPSDELPRIWDRLYRGDQSRTEKGLGLGLNLVKGIVHAHNGRIDVVSEPGKGSTFIIRLPVHSSI